MTDSPARTRQKLTNYRTAFIALVVALVGLAGLLAASWPSLMDPGTGWQVFTSQLGGILITTGGLGILWELRGRRDVVEEVLDKARLSTDVQTAGLRQVTMDWKAVDWSELFAGTREVELFVAYATTWRNTHWTKLQDFASKKNNKLTVYLPSPDDDITMKSMARRYQYTRETIQEKIKETAESFASLSSASGAAIKIYYREGDPTHTCYRFDGDLVVTMYSHKRVRGEVPTLILTKGAFSEFFSTDLEAVRKQSIEVPLEQLQLAGGSGTK